MEGFSKERGNDNHNEDENMRQPVHQKGNEAFNWFKDEEKAKHTNTETNTLDLDSKERGKHQNPYNK